MIEDDVKLRRLKRELEISCQELSKAATSMDRDDIIMWYRAFRSKESEIYELERRMELH